MDSDMSRKPTKTSLALLLEYRTKPKMLFRDQGAARHFRKHEAILTGEPESGGSPVFLGKLEFKEIALAACMNDGLSRRALLDHDDETLRISNLLFEDTDGDVLCSALDEEMAGEPVARIINLEFLTVMPFARGKKLGLTILDNILRDFPTETIFIMHPTPLQFVKSDDGGGPDWSNMKLEEFSRDEAAGTAKLNDYYRRLGFKPLGDGWLFLTSVQVRKKFRAPDYITIPTA